MDNDFETFKAFNLNWNTKMSFQDKLQIAEKSDQLNNNGCIVLENDDVYLAKVYLEKALGTEMIVASEMSEVVSNVMGR